MTGTGPPPLTQVTGGSGGLAATYARVLGLATTYDAAGTRMRDWAAAGARTAGSGDLVESAILAPVTFAEAELAVLAATTGPDGVLVESVAWETDAVLVRVTVRTLQETDELVHGVLEGVDYLAGRTVGHTLVAAAAPLLAAGLVTVLTAGPAAYGAWSRLSPALRQRVATAGAATGAATVAGAEDWLLEHPDLLQHAVNGAGGLLDGLVDGVTPGVPGGPWGLPSFTPDTESAAGTLAALYGDDGSPRVTALGPSGLGPGTRPGDLSDLLAHLDRTRALSDRGPESTGIIEVQTIRDAEGHARHIVYLPGTDDMTTLPWTQDGDVRDLATNLRLVHGQDTTHVRGILESMRRAGIAPQDPVLLAGHSQGGMAAVALLGGRHDFNVTNVVTAGSPTAQVSGFPPGSHVLSLENHGDVVPLLDGEDNPDSVQQVTVRFADPGADPADSHALVRYAAGAAAVDASDHPSLVEQLDDLRAAGFLGGGGATVTSRIYRLTRDP